MSIKTQDIAGDGLYGYLAQSETAGKGSVLIMPTIFGVNPFVRGYADTWRGPGLQRRCAIFIPANRCRGATKKRWPGRPARRCHGR